MNDRNEVRPRTRTKMGGRMMGKFIDVDRIQEILMRAPLVGQRCRELAEFVSKELGALPAVEPIFAMVGCDRDGAPTLKSMDELCVADIDWFENVPPAISAMMGAMSPGEIAYIWGEFDHFANEYDTPFIVKRVL